MKNKIIFRADGSTENGLGHLYRCSALAEMLQDTFTCYFYTRNPDLLNLDQVEIQVIQLSKAEDLDNEAGGLPLDGSEIVVLDGYQFSTNYQAILKSKGCKVVCIDDLADQHFVADVVINHSPAAKNSDYSIETHTQLLLGLDYVLLRKPFLIEKAQRSIVDQSSVVICLGGSDIQNLTWKILQVVGRKKEVWTVHIVVGAAYKNFEQLCQASTLFPDKDIRIHQSVDADKMTEIMNSAGLAIVSSSGILWETIAMGLKIITGYYADNQKKNAGYFLENNYKGIRSIGNLMAEDLEQKINMAYESLKSDQFPEKMIDKNSPKRILKCFWQLINYDIIQYRKAEAEDLELYYEWANDTEVRQNSIEKDLIPFEDHKNWFESKLKSDKTKMFVFHLDRIPVGQVRFDMKGNNSYYVDYSVDSEYRGKGLGSIVLKKAISALKAEKDYGKLIAEVFEGNQASLGIFDKLGFSRNHERLVNGRKLIAFEYDF